ncbi:hypothetical protein KUTeg_024247 [Tegillarca granosa]|uniref:dCMP deaminase n=1 Tax=Tegillarca granosa TaxID=220873 RepID=A0ABQ9E1X0_TEGGR|nr:hypothetical protein KUTeg_024247 [Tegillarca granosa]
MAEEKRGDRSPKLECEEKSLFSTYEAKRQNGTDTKKDDPLRRKRDGYLQWPDYFMAIAFLSAQRSKDPRTQVGACIVNEDNKIVGIGYNGMPVGCNDDIMPWSRHADDILDTKQLYVLNKNSADVKNCKIYVALFPCNECAKVVIQSGIKEVIYYSNKYHEKPEFIASKRMFDVAGVKYRLKKSILVIDI